MDAIRNKLIAATTALAGRAVDSLAKKAKLPDFRRDPAYADIYLRYDALDTLISLRKEILASTQGNLRDTFHSVEQADALLTRGLELPTIIDTLSEELQQSIRPEVERLERTHGDALADIEIGLRSLDTGEAPLNPTATHPASLMKAFVDSISTTALEPRGKVLLCELYAQEIEPGLGKFYGQLREGLARIPRNERASPIASAPTSRADTARGKDLAGTPGIRSDPEARKDSPTRQEEDLPLLETPGSSAAGKPAPASDEEVFDIVVQNANSGGGSPLSIYQRQQIADALTLIQGHPEQPGVDRIKAAIAKVLYDGGAFDAADLVQKEGPVIDFATDIFREVLTSDRIDERLRKLVERLQIPVVKLAVMNFGVFRDPENPTRKFLSLFLDMAVYASYRDEAFSKRLEQIVETLADQPDAGPEAFTAGLRQLHTLEKQFDVAQGAAAGGDPTRQIEGLDLRMEQARRLVEELTTHDREQWRSPRWVGDFVHTIWAPYMVRMLAERGEYSAEWKEALYVYHQLLTTSRPGGLDTPEQTLEQINSLIGPLDLYFETITSRLQAVPPQSTDWKHQLEKTKRWYKGLHYRLVDATLDIDHVPRPHAAVRTTREGRETESPRSPDTTAQPPREAGESTGHPARSLPSTVRAGMWFEIYRGPGRGKRRLKLSTTRNLENGVRFENRSGQEELSIDLDTFLDDLLAGRTRPISDSNVFDQALSHVISNIRSTRNP